MRCVFVTFVHKDMCGCVHIYPLNVYMLIPTARGKDILWSENTKVSFYYFVIVF